MAFPVLCAQYFRHFPEICVHQIIQRICLCLLMPVLAAAAGGVRTVPLQLEEFATAGRQYTITQSKVNNLALENSLEFTADLLPGLPRNPTTLQQQTDAMQQRAALVQASETYLNTQARYFAELNALAKGDQSTGTTRALKQLVEALNKAPNLGNIPRASKEGVAGLAGHVASWQHSAQVRNELQQSAEPVALALLTNPMILEEQIRWISQRQHLARQLEYRDEVLKPFIEDKELPERWKRAWMASVKPPPMLCFQPCI
jgi:hypothetical protein